MIESSTGLYPTNPECLLSVFDLRHPDGAPMLHRLRAIHREYSDIEALDIDHYVLIGSPDAAEKVGR